MDEITFAAKGISVSLDLTVGHLADLTIEAGKRQLRPLHRAPWIDEPLVSLPPDLPRGVVRLSGDFLCAPFSRSDVEEAPLHGWPANSAWEIIESRATQDGWRATFHLRRKVMGATVEKTLILRNNHPFLYQEHAFIGGSGAISVAHHTMTAMKAGGRLAFSPKRLAATPDAALDPDPKRGSYLLAYPGRSFDLSRFPASAGDTFDLREYRMDRSHEDFVTLVEADDATMGWTAVARKAEADLVLVMKNPAQLPVTMLWISNGGRDYAPWKGRHRGVIGIEDGRTAIGHAASIGENWLTREDVPTAFQLGERVSFRHVIGALPLSDAQPPQNVVAEGALLRVEGADGLGHDVPFDAQFLAIERYSTL